MASFSINSYQRGSQINLKIKSWLLKRIWINFLFFFFYSNFQRCCFFSLCLCLCNCKPEWDKKRYPKSHPAECVLSLGLTPLPQGNLFPWELLKQSRLAHRKKYLVTLCFRYCHNWIILFAMKWNEDPNLYFTSVTIRFSDCATI